MAQPISGKEPKSPDTEGEAVPMGAPFELSPQALPVDQVSQRQQSPPMASVSNRRAEVGGVSPPVAVPLIVPRYQRKTRQYNEMTLTDTAKSAKDVVSASDLLRQRSIEALTIRSGKVQYSDEVTYHTYAMFRHGSSKIHTNSVGYSSEGELVLTKEEISSECESDPSRLQRRAVAVTSAVCLDPYARRAMTDDELTSSRKINASKLKKFPGVKAPKNRRVRNRLKNDHFANELARDLYKKAKEHDEDVDPLVQPSPPTFPQHEALEKLVHVCSDAQDAKLEKKGISPILRAQKAEQHPDSAEARFQQLSSRLKDELKHSMKSVELTKVIGDLEAKFTAFLTSAAPAPQLELTLFDSYCRLICHGVAGYYRLNSKSEEFEGAEAGQKKTIVSKPKGSATIPLPQQTLLSFLQRKPAVEPFATESPPPLELPESEAGAKASTSAGNKKSQPKAKKGSSKRNGGAQERDNAGSKADTESPTDDKPRRHKPSHAQPHQRHPASGRGESPQPDSDSDNDGTQSPKVVSPVLRPMA